MTVAGRSWIGTDVPVIRRGDEEYFLLGHESHLYLVSNRCPHRGGPLKFGFVNDRDEIVCPMHKNAIAIPWLLKQPSTLRLTEQAVTS